MATDLLPIIIGAEASGDIKIPITKIEPGDIVFNAGNVLEYPEQLFNEPFEMWVKFNPNRPYCDYAEARYSIHAEEGFIHLGEKAWHYRDPFLRAFAGGPPGDPNEDFCAQLEKSLIHEGTAPEEAEEYADGIRRDTKTMGDDEASGGIIGVWSDEK